jgi:hypothetical protein
MSQWKSNDNLFSLHGFYNNIVALFEQDPQDPWVIDTLEWWNGYVLFIYLIYRLILHRQVPGLHKMVSKHKKRSSPLDNRIRSNPADRILEQRARHAVNITSNQEYQQPEHQASHPHPLPVQQPSVSSYSQIGQSHGDHMGQQRSLNYNFEDDLDNEHQELDLEEEDQARLREAQKSERQQLEQTEKARSPLSHVSSSITNSPVFETAAMQVSQTAAKRVSCMILHPSIL